MNCPSQSLAWASRSTWAWVIGVVSGMMVGGAVGGGGFGSMLGAPMPTFFGLAESSQTHLSLRVSPVFYPVWEGCLVGLNLLTKVDTCVR